MATATATAAKIRRSLPALVELQESQPGNALRSRLAREIDVRPIGARRIAVTVNGATARNGSEARNLATMLIDSVAGIPEGTISDYGVAGVSFTW